MTFKNYADFESIIRRVWKNSGSDASYTKKY